MSPPEGTGVRWGNAETFPPPPVQPRPSLDLRIFRSAPHAPSRSLSVGRQFSSASARRTSGPGSRFSAAGDVVGIDTALYSETGGSVGLGFAAPVDRAARTGSELQERGAVDRSYHTTRAS
ncbi:MAG: hypothetical protein BRD35_06525 [Bacteroidetes bacterium QH_7_62_13]|nr:MAG: hypothetical protein BRD35_06525 [Bacteroidetes bacterium QH_7_62_13]